MVLSIAFVVLYIVLVVLFPRKESKTMPSVVRAAFMMGFPLLAGVMFLQLYTLDRKYFSLIEPLKSRSIEEVYGRMSMATDVVLPLVFDAVAAVFIIMGMVRVIKAPLSEESSQFAFGGSSDGQFHKDCARDLSFCGIIYEVVSLAFGVGFAISMAELIQKGIENAEGIFVIGGICMWLCIFGILIPFGFVVTFPLAIRFAGEASIWYVLNYITDFSSMILFGLFSGIHFTAAAVIGVCAAVKMKKSGSVGIVKTIFYIIGSLIPIVNIFVLGNIRKTAR